MQDVLTIWIFVGLGVVAVMFFLAMLARLYRKVGPHEALVVYGLGGMHVIKEGGKVIFPMVQTWRLLSLELMSFDVAPQQDLYTTQGVAVTVEAVAQIKVKSDDTSVRTAAEQFLTKTPDERDTAIKRAEAMRASAIAKAQADQERVLAETLSLAKQSEAQRDLEVKRAAYAELVKKQQ